MSKRLKLKDQLPKSKARPSPVVTRSTAAMKNKTSKRKKPVKGNSTPSNKRRFSEVVYEISDTSDTEFDDVMEVINITDTSENTSDLILIDEAAAFPSTSTDDRLNENIEEPTTEALPSESRSDIHNYIDSLIKARNRDDDLFRSVVDEFAEQTDVLLERSKQLLKNSLLPLNKSEVVICTNNDIVAKKDDDKKLEDAVVENVTIKEKESSKPQCPICLEDLGSAPVSSTICGHIFCKECIRNCIVTTRRCPTCRKSLTLKMVHPLFLSF